MASRASIQYQGAHGLPSAARAKGTYENSVVFNQDLDSMGGCPRCRRVRTNRFA